MKRVKKVTTSERSEASETSIENKTKPDKENKIIMSSVEVNIVRLQGLIDGETNQTVMLAYLAQQTEWVKQRVGNSFPNSFAIPYSVPHVASLDLPFDFENELVNYCFLSLCLAATVLENSLTSCFDSID